MPSKLPNKILPLPCKDKEGWTEKWTPQRNLLNFPGGTKILMIARPNAGKSTVVKNILLRADPMYEKIFLLHCDDDSEDYADIQLTHLKEMPEQSFFDRETKKLLIIDDFEFKNMKKDDLRKLSTLFRYASSHKNLSIFTCTQNFYSLPIIVRRTSNCFVLWDNNDKRYIQDMASKCMIPKKKFLELFSHLTNFHDSLWIDLTKGSPAKIRINGYNIP